MLDGGRSFRGRVVLVALFAITVDLFRLREGFALFRRELVRVRRRQPMRKTVFGGSGAVEPKLVSNLTRWNLHAHLLLDANATSIGEAEIAEQWHRATGGTFSLHAQDLLVRSPSAFSKYATKTTSWAPAPGELDLQRLELLRKGIRGRQLVIRWGSGRGKAGERA